MNKLSRAVMCLVGLIFSVGTMAQDYPSRPVRLIQQFAPGGGSDSVARPMAPKLERALGESILVESKAGENGAIANQYMTTQPADGYTLLFAAAGPMTAAPHLYDLRVDPMAEFIPVSLAVKTPYVIIANESVNVSSFEELIELAKQEPGSVTY